MKKNDDIVSISLSSAEVNIIYRALSAAYLETGEELKNFLEENKDNKTEAFFHDLKCKSLEKEEIGSVLQDFCWITNHHFPEEGV